MVCCCITFINSTAYTSSQKLLNKSTHAVTISKKFSWHLLLTVFFDVALRRHNDVVLLPAMRRVSDNDFVFQQDSVLAQQLNCSVKKRQTLLRPTRGLQTAQISILWITRSGLSCSIVSTTDKSYVGELKRRLIDVRCGLEQSFLTRLKEDTSSTARELTMLILSTSVTFSLTWFLHLSLQNYASNVGQYILVHFTG